MKEKKEVKIKFKSALLIIVIIETILLIGCICFIIIKCKNKNPIEETDKTILNQNLTTTTSLNKTDEEIINQAKKTFEKFLKIEVFEDSNIGPMPYILKELGLETEEQIEKEIKDVNDTKTYIKSSTKYEEFKKEMLKYMTEELFNKNYSQYKNMDGYVGFCNVAAEFPTTSIEDMKLISKDSDSYQFTITLKDDELYEHSLNGENIKKEEYLNDIKANFKMVNNYLVVSSRDYGKYNKLVEEKNNETKKVEESKEEEKTDDYIVLYNGDEFKTKVGVHQAEIDSDKGASKYNITYYNYEKGKYVGETKGKYSEDAIPTVQNVKTIAISKKYNAIPRNYEKVKELPKELQEMADYPGLDIEKIDLDGDGKKEYIICWKVDYKEGEIGDGKAQSSSGYMLLDSNYKKIANLATLEDGFAVNSQRKEEDKIFLKIDNVHYIDIDNDGIMEIVIGLPAWEWTNVAVYKYKNGKIEGDLDYKVDLNP